MEDHEPRRSRAPMMRFALRLRRSGAVVVPALVSAVALCSHLADCAATGMRVKEGDGRNVLSQPFFGGERLKENIWDPLPNCSQALSETGCLRRDGCSFCSKGANSVNPSCMAWNECEGPPDLCDLKAEQDCTEAAELCVWCSSQGRCVRKDVTNPTKPGEEAGALPLRTANCSSATPPCPWKLNSSYATHLCTGS